jgi:aminoglycoside phosphotransferase (APT) family kinase protein
MRSPTRGQGNPVSVSSRDPMATDETGHPAPAAVDPMRDIAAPELAAVRSGEDLDWLGIETYLRANLPDDLDVSGDFEVLQFPNGAANLTYLIRFGQRELVLRRPPFGTLAPGAHDMKREHKVLSRLWRHFDRAPRAFLLCDDPAVAGADFFVMERRRGEVIRGIVPENMRGHPEVGRRMGTALVEAMADFHLLDPEACGLSDLGRPDGFALRQVEGWKKRWDLVADPKHDEAMSAVHARLAETVPSPQRVSFVHNDLKLDNCMFDPADPDRVIAFFDWDMTTLGDPLIDLGTLLNYWPDPADGAHSRGSHAGEEKMGLPARAEVKKVYAERTGLDLSRAGWYEAFAQWKTATVVEQLHYRWVVGDSKDPRMETIAVRVPELAETASRLLDDLA